MERLLVTSSKCDDIYNFQSVDKTIKVDFKEFEKKLGIRIVEAGVSSGCYHVVDALFSFYMKGSLNKFKDLPLIFETNVQKPDKVKRKLLCFGTCVRKYKKEWDYLSECHPNAGKCNGFLQN